MFCSCDMDGAEFIKEELRKAKIPHRCGECGYQIPVGEHYEYVYGRWDGVTSVHKTCERCLDLRENLQVVYLCFYYEFLFEMYHDYLIRNGFTNIEAHIQIGRIKRKHKNY
jgi:hypothetical protein